MAVGRATISHPNIAIDLFEDPRAAARAGWDDLVAAADAPIFYQSTYLTAYHEAPLATFDRVGYLMAREARTGTPLAVLPFAVHRDPDPLGALRITHPGIEQEPVLLSHVWHCYDTQVVSGTKRPEVVAAILTFLRDRARQWGVRWFGFINVARGSFTASALQAANMRGHHLIDRFTADLTGLGDLDDYVRRLPERARANLRRNARRAVDAGMHTAVGPPASVDLVEVAQLCARTATRFGNSGFYPIDTFVRFVERLGPAAHVLTIRQRGRLVAAGVCLTDERRFHTWTCGVDYDVTGNASPYTLLFTESVRLALQLRRPILEGGRSNDVFKRRHGLVPLALDAYLAPTE